MGVVLPKAITCQSSDLSHRSSLSSYCPEQDGWRHQIFGNAPARVHGEILEARGRRGRRPYEADCRRLRVPFAHLCRG